MYFDNFLPFIQNYGYLESNRIELVNADSVYCPITSKKSLEELEKDSVVDFFISKRTPKVYHINPVGIKVFAESDTLAYYMKYKLAGQTVPMDVTYINYDDIAKNINVVNGVATLNKNGGMLVNEVITELFINSASNGVGINIDNLKETGNDIEIPLGDRISIFSLFENLGENGVQEAVDFDTMFNKFQQDKRVDVKTDKIDYVYTWLDGYFQMPEGMEMKDGQGREVVPLMIGPTGVFKSATVKSLCEKYGFRLVDFRVAFTSRLDYSGLYQKGSSVLEQDFSYACPMEELVTCSDGFRMYSRQAVEKLKDTLAKGVLVTKRSTSGDNVVEETTPLTNEHLDKINKMIENYNEYIKTPVLFFDEITRNKNKGVEGVLVQLLNQKRYNTMTLKGCKFVAATNLNFKYDVINDIYQVNPDIDVAFSNRFLPLQVRPELVTDRWIEWAEKPNKDDKNRNNIDPLIMEYLKTKPGNIYEEQGVLEAYNKSEDDAIADAAATPYPNYRTWEMTSNYVISRKDKKLSRKSIEGLLGVKVADEIIKFLSKKGYVEDVPTKDTDDMGKFLSDSLDAGLPAMIIGPSSMGKTGRINEYVKKVEKETGSRPIIININLAGMDNVDIMGMPTKKSLSSFVLGEDGFEMSNKKDDSLNMLAADLKSICKDIETNGGTGLVDYVTVRSPDRGIKETFRKALENNIMVILFFDECNRVTNDSLMSCMFEAISDCFVGSTKIKMLDGTTKTMRDLYDLYSSTGEGFWVYSCTKEGKIVPGYAHSPRVISGEEKRLVKVTLDNGSSEVCTDYHLWMLRNGDYKRTDELEEGTSLMPLYTRNSRIDTDGIDGYDMVWDNESCSWIMVHRTVAKALDLIESGKVIHHKDFDKRNNDPKNLDCSMNYKEHIEFHGQHLQEIKEKTNFEEKRRLGYSEWLNNGGRDFLKKHALVMSLDGGKKSAETRKKLCKESKEYTDRLAAGLVRFNIETGVDGRKSEWMREHHKKHPEIGKRFQKSGAEGCIKKWKDPEYKDKMVEIHKERCKDNAEFKDTMRGNAIKNNKNPEIKKKQILGKVVKVVFKCVALEGYVSETLYESVRLNHFRYGYPRYKRAMEIIRDFGIEEISEVALNYNHKVVSIEYQEYKEDVYDITVEEYHNFALDSGVFVHNSKIFGIDFTAQKHLVRIVGACNMGEGYTGAKGLDAALTARFAMFWKKKYDDKDVVSFKNFLKDNVASGNIDPILSDYFDSLSPDEALKFMSSVEKRTIEKAEPSSRMLLQLAKDIKNMRSNKTASGSTSSCFNGTVLFSLSSRNDMTKFSAVLKDTSADINDKISKGRDLVSYVRSNYKRWDAYIKDTEVTIQGQKMKTSEALDLLFKADDKIVASMTLADKTMINNLLTYTLGLLTALADIDGRVEDLRKDLFTAYAGEEFTKGFLPYFNERFGKENDVEITIAMLDDMDLIPEFFTRKTADTSKLNPDMKVTYIIGLLDEFWDCWGSGSLPSENFAKFYEVAMKSFVTTDDVVVLLRRLGPKQDPFMTRAEGVGDQFIKNSLSVYKKISDVDINAIKASMSTSGVGVAKKAKILV